ncbi:MAG: putative short-subunit dehydrogenase-like oxidoreductase (DUF2520 family) [Myxococcota bacterium]|jgi:predicted short-subunit dehydrogenase-like oxidoreductase (DUF2520 family)
MSAVNIIGLGRVGKTLRLLHQNAGDSICATADCVIFSVPDDKLADAIAEYVANNQCLGKFMVHVSGVHGAEIMDLAAKEGALTAALHPIMQFADLEPQSNADNLQHSFVSCSAGVDAQQQAATLVARWGAKIIVLDDDVDRYQYHLALSLTSNHVTGLMAWAHELLQPSLGAHSSQIIEQMALRAVKLVDAENPLQSLTGPIARGDIKTIEHHLSCLDDEQRQRYQGLLLNLRALVEQRSE